MGRLEKSGIGTEDVDFDVIVALLEAVHDCRTVPLSDHFLVIMARHRDGVDYADSCATHFPTVVLVSTCLFLVGILVIRTPPLFLLLFILLLIIRVARVILEQIDCSLEDVGSPLIHLTRHTLKHRF